MEFVTDVAGCLRQMLTSRTTPQAGLGLVLVAALLLVDGVLARAGQTPPSLKISVIAGEDAVNIIQQKSTVAPVVEVRDRNDLPVAGASVLFLIGGQDAATFANGLRQLTVVTDAAGRAAANGLTPLARGTFQIQVRATFQNQVATATIEQTNFATASQAAEAAAATRGSGGSSGAASAAGGATGGPGGGLSALAIGSVAGGAAAAVATAVAVGGSDTASNEPPSVAGVVASPSIGLQATTIAFSAGASDANGDALTYAWDFGDGGTATGANPTHLYTVADTFTVRVTVGDGKASASAQTTVIIRSLTGSWLSSLIPAVCGGVTAVQFSLVQSGATITGSGPSASGLCSPWLIASSSVRPTPPQVTVATTFIVFGASAGGLTFTGVPGPDINVLTGTFSGFGALAGIAVPGTLTRQ